MKRALCASRLVALCLSSGAARAFDCAKAGTAIEKAICADPKLKSLDDELGRAFGALRKSEAVPKGPLVESQRAWLESVRDECANTPPLEECLSDAYRARLEFLKQAPATRKVERVGGREVVTLHRGFPSARTISYPVLTSDDSPAHQKIAAFIDRELESKHQCDGEDPAGAYSTEVSATVTAFKELQIVSVHIAASLSCGGPYPSADYSDDYFDAATGEHLQGLLEVDTSKEDHFKELHPSPAGDAQCNEAYLNSSLTATLGKGTIHFGVEHNPHALAACDGAGVDVPFAEAARFLTAGSAIRKLPAFNRAR